MPEVTPPFYSTSFTGADTVAGATAVDDWVQESTNSFYKANGQARSTRSLAFTRLMRPTTGGFSDTVLEVVLPPNTTLTSERARVGLVARNNNSTGAGYFFFVDPFSKHMRIDRSLSFGSTDDLTSYTPDFTGALVSFASYDNTKPYLLRFACVQLNPTTTSLKGQLYQLDNNNNVLSKVAECNYTDTFAGLQNATGTAAICFYKYNNNSTYREFDDFKWSQVTDGTINADYVSTVNNGPTLVSASAPSITAAGGATNRITATFTDADGVDAASMTNAVEVLYPNGSTVVQATFVSSSVSGSNRTGLWDIAAPGGTWAESGNGTYTYRLKANQLKDSSNNFSPAQTLGTFSVSIPPAGGGTLEIGATNSLLVRSVNWYDRGNGSVDTNYLGAYIKGAFTGSTLSVKTLNGDAFRSFVCQIDDGAFTKYTPASGAQTISLATGLSAGAHTFRLVYSERENGHTDRWLNPELIVVSFMASTFTQQARLAGDILIYGDSIYQGYNGVSINGTGFALGEASGKEFALKAFGGTGWQATGSENAPNIQTSWNFQRSGISLQYAGTPDYVLINMGTNDGTDGGTVNTTIRNAIQNTLNGMRTKWPTSYLLVQVPFRQTFVATIDAAIAALADPKIKKVNAGAHLNRQLTGTSGYYSSDGLHPNPVAHAALVGGTMQSLGIAVAGGSNTGTGTTLTAVEIASAVWSNTTRSLTASVTTDSTSRTATASLVTGFATPANITSAQTAIINRGDTAWITGMTSIQDTRLNTLFSLVNGGGTAFTSIALANAPTSSATLTDIALAVKSEIQPLLFDPVSTSVNIGKVSGVPITSISDFKATGFATPANITSTQNTITAAITSTQNNLNNSITTSQNAIIFNQDSITTAITSTQTNLNNSITTSQNAIISQGNTAWNTGLTTTQNTKLNLIPTDNNLSSITSSIRTNLDSDLNLIKTRTKFASARVTNKLVIDPITKKEILYDDNKITPLVTKNLASADGSPNSEDIYSATPI